MLASLMFLKPCLLIGFGSIGMPELIIIFTIVLLIFGGKKLPELARGLGKGIREFKRATSEVQDEFQKTLEEDTTKDNETSSTSKKAVREEE